MGWGRVIQDSDEDEPLGEDVAIEASAPHDAGQEHVDSRPDLQAHVHHNAAEQQADYPIERRAERDTPAPVEPEMNINFDQFLQSQDTTHSAPTLSQQRREERWIPSATEGGSGSIGAMLTEIGHAQRRLIEDDVPSADDHLPSTSSGLPSEISQPGSYPMMESFGLHQQRWREEHHYDQAFLQPPLQVEASCSDTQPFEPTPVQGNELDCTPVTKSNVAFPSGERNPQPMSVAVNTTPGPQNDDQMPIKTIQRSRSMQPQTWSPHDTQPLSPVHSPGVSRSRSDNITSSLVSPQHSELSAHDELALPGPTPTINLDSPAVRKPERGRPKKQPLHAEDDEEDELAAAAPRDYFTARVWMAGERQRPESSLSRKTEIFNPDPEHVETDGGLQDKPRHTPGLMVVLPVVFDEKSRTGKVKDPRKSQDTASPKPSKQKKAKRSKTASEVLDKPTRMHATDDDDIILMGSTSLQIKQDNVKDGAHDSPLELDPNQPPAEENPGPKRRGRKRKQPADPPSAPDSDSTTPVSKEPQDQQDQPSKNTAEFSSNPIPKMEENQLFVPWESPVQTKKTAVENNHPAPKEATPAANTFVPNTPQRMESRESDPQTARASNKGPARHSPILSTTKVPYRVGLSKRARIAPLLKVVRK
ncbi:hypothetical protein POX_d04951 [Penicillium oxalicum]|uniref:hypothetical protein n=1 Tax=Penicillium oxalicum TaxID=69781 RepID=UPI0020B8DDC4|nr:hypothetical protein POX_d04951 [Penicillium oxalicum]KAI2789460.1 hypothetical protein POX_d04951 [Penicillium oxalicum]